MGLYYHITVGLLRIYISPNKYKLTVCILFHCHLLPKENTSTQTLFSELFVSKDWEFHYLTHWTSACVYTTAGLYIIQLRLVIQLTITHNGVILPYHCGVIKGLQ